MAITSIRKWGNSQGVTIPKAILDKLNWSGGETVKVVTENHEIVIRRKHKRKNIKQLFDGFEGQYEPIDIDWGKPVGKEIW